MRLAARPVRSTALGLVLVALAACGTPYERCVAPVAREIRTIDGLIAELQTDIARGYTLVPERSWERRVVLCAAPDNRSRFCFVDEPVTTTRARAIDRDAERRKLAGLQERRAELDIAARQQQAACAAAHPQG